MNVMNDFYPNTDLYFCIDHYDILRNIVFTPNSTKNLFNGVMGESGQLSTDYTYISPN